MCAQEPSTSPPNRYSNTVLRPGSLCVIQAGSLENHLDLDPMRPAFLVEESGSEKKKQTKKKDNKHSTGFFRAGGDFIHVFCSHIGNDTKNKTHKQIFGTRPVPGQSRKFVYVYVFFLSLTYCPRRNYYRINSGKGGSGNFSDFFTGINSFQTDSSNLSCKKSKA